MTLYWLRHAPDIQDLAVDFGLVLPHEALRHVIHALLLGLKDEIRFPDAKEQAVLREKNAWVPFNNAIAAVDGTYSPKTRGKWDNNQHHKCFSRNLQAMIDVNGRIIFARGEQWISARLQADNRIRHSERVEGRIHCIGRWWLRQHRGHPVCH